MNETWSVTYSERWLKVAQGVAWLWHSWMHDKLDDSFICVSVPSNYPLFVFVFTGNYL